MQCSMPQLVLAANLPLKLKREVPICKHTEQLKLVAGRAIAAMRTQPGQQGDKLEYRVTVLVQIAKPGLRAGRDSQENMPSSMPEVKCHPTIRTKRCLATTSDSVGPISGHQRKKTVVAWKI